MHTGATDIFLYLYIVGLSMTNAWRLKSQLTALVMNGRYECASSLLLARYALFFILCWVGLCCKDLGW